jgi:DnaK suppressor protein
MATKASTKKTAKAGKTSVKSKQPPARNVVKAGSKKSSLSKPSAKKTAPKKQLISKKIKSLGSVTKKTVSSVKSKATSKKIASKNAPKLANKVLSNAKQVKKVTVAKGKVTQIVKPKVKQADVKVSALKNGKKEQLDSVEVKRTLVKAVASEQEPKKTLRNGPVAVAVVSSKDKSTTSVMSIKKPSQPIKVSGNEVIRPVLPSGYKPNAKEAYMNPNQVEYFRLKLMKWRVELVEESKQTIDNLRDEVRDVGDEAERATRETENSLELRTRDRYRKLISKIDKALRRMDDGEYGYCEETGEEIGIERLEARPIATLCLDAQERWEHRQRQMGD